MISILATICQNQVTSNSLDIWTSIPRASRLSASPDKWEGPTWPWTLSSLRKIGSKFNSWRWQHIQLICALERLQNPQCRHAIQIKFTFGMCFLALRFLGVPDCCRFDKLAARNLAKTGRLRMIRESSQPIELANSWHSNTQFCTCMQDVHPYNGRFFHYQFIADEASTVFLALPRSDSGQAQTNEKISVDSEFLEMWQFPKGMVKDQLIVYTDIYKPWNTSDSAFLKSCTSIVGITANMNQAYQPHMLPTATGRVHYCTSHPSGWSLVYPI